MFGEVMPDLTPQEREEIISLLHEGEHRLGLIKGDLDALLRQSQNTKDPAAKMIGVALSQIDIAEQFKMIAQSRRKIRLIRAKFDIDEYSSDDEEAVLKELDAIKAIAEKIREASAAYAAFIRRRTEMN